MRPLGHPLRMKTVALTDWRRLVGNHKGCPYKCNGVDNHEGCPRKCCGVEGTFPRGSVHHHRPKTPQRSAGQTCLCRARHGRQERPFPPQGQFAEKQPPPACACCLTHACLRAARKQADRQAGALLFRPFSWAGNERQPAASPPPPFSPFPLRKGGRGDRSLYRNTSTGFARAARTT